MNLAKKIGGEIVSADSMQVYRRMDIGSAKVTKEEMQGVPHYLIDEFDPDGEFHVVKFQEYAKRYIQEIHSAEKFRFSLAVPVFISRPSCTTSILQKMAAI